MRLLAVWLLGLMAVAQAQTAAPVDTPSFDLSANLRSACWKGDLPEVTRLINAGASIEGRDSLLRTPLFLACHGSPEIVKLLLAHGARGDVVDKDGDTTIGRACEYGDLESAKLVLAAGADMNRENKYGRTPLMLAAREGRDALVALLIANHVDVNHEGITSPAIYYATVCDHLSIVQMLLDAGAHVKRMPGLNPNNPDKEPILGKAAYVNDLPLIDMLLAHGADINESATDSGRSVLMYAAQSAKPATISHLLEKGADANAQNNNGETPLMLAINYKPTSVLGTLLDHGGKLETKDNKGRTALMWAAHFGLFPQLHFLVDSGADVNATDNAGDSALTYASDIGATDLVRFLEEKGAKQTSLHIVDKGMGSQLQREVKYWALPVDAGYKLITDGNPLLRLEGDVTRAVGTVYARFSGGNAPPWLAEFREQAIRAIYARFYGDSFPPKTADSWALAVGAIYAQYNGENPQVLGYDANAYDPDDAKSELKENWGITDKTGFLNEQEIMRGIGNRTEYQNTGIALAALSDDDFSAMIKRLKLDLASEVSFRAERASYQKWKDRTGLAWDLCRRANLISWAYAAGLLKEDEAWQLLLSNAQQVQQSFGSWQELSDNFLDGREIWAGARDPRFAACVDLLLNSKDTNSPWNQLPWNTNLGSADAPHP